MSEFKLGLSRSKTFDQRSSTPSSTSLNLKSTDPEETSSASTFSANKTFFSPINRRRAMTFVGSSSSPSMLKNFLISPQNSPKLFSSPYDVHDILFRKHFYIEEENSVNTLLPMGHHNLPLPAPLPTPLTPPNLISLTPKNKLKKDFQFAPDSSPVGSPSNPIRDPITGQRKVAIVVDAFSTGAMLSHVLYQAGYLLISVLSGDLKHLLEMMPEGLTHKYIDTIVYEVELDNYIEENSSLSPSPGNGLPIPISPGFEKVIQDINSIIETHDLSLGGVFAGGETGVSLSERLSEYYNLPSNGTTKSLARRNKFIMGETVRNSGVRAVRQIKATNWNQVEEWVQAESKLQSHWYNDSEIQFKVIVKPLDSAGSDDVTLCTTIEEVKNAYGNIMGKVNSLGFVNSAVLVQEFLEGREYIVDMVSCDGHHKLAAIWSYDRRSVNGGGFVCFGQKLLTSFNISNSELANEGVTNHIVGVNGQQLYDHYFDHDEDEINRCKALVEYQKKVLDALGIKNGPSHGEVKWCRGEPVLVEVGSRCQGGDGMWVSVVDECFGYNQIQMTVLSILHKNRFLELPDEPQLRKAHGYLKWLINYKYGDFNGVDEKSLAQMKSNESYRNHQIFIQKGKVVYPTCNCFTWGGCVKMVNKNETKLLEYYRELEILEETSLFNVTPIKTDNKFKQVIAVVDPFSTGAVLAAELYKRGFAVVAVYSAGLEQLASLENLIPQGLQLSFESIIPFDSDIQVMINSLSQIAPPNNLHKNTLKGLDRELIAVLAGTETGVELADKLSELLGLPTNGSLHSEARRNKFVMGETIRSYGVDAVLQLRATSWNEIQEWVIEQFKLDKFNYNEQTIKVIVKPLDSAGSDGVTLCKNLIEVKLAYEKILGKINGLGLTNSEVLVQEYLEGEEYVVDMVSCNGYHKCVAVWLYDRRPVNGAGFVCFGQRIIISDEDDDDFVHDYVGELDASPETCNVDSSIFYDEEKKSPHSTRVRELVKYMKNVLDALGIRYGPAHGEVKWCPRRNAPILIEVGARCHGAEGAWIDLSQAVLGYDQVKATIDSYTLPLPLHANFYIPEVYSEKSESFIERYPDYPMKRFSYSRLLFFITYVDTGILSSIDVDSLESIRSLSSFHMLEFFIKPPQKAVKTIDCFSFAGNIRLINNDLKKLKEDVHFIRHIEKNGLFKYSS